MLDRPSDIDSFLKLALKLSTLSTLSLAALSSWMSVEEAGETTAALLAGALGDAGGDFRDDMICEQRL